MTVYLVISLPKIPYIHRIYMVLANPTHVCALCFHLRAVTDMLALVIINGHSCLVHDVLVRFWHTLKEQQRQCKDERNNAGHGRRCHYSCAFPHHS